MSERGPSLPTPREWLRLGIHVEAELHAGKQSRVFDGTLDGQRVAVKLTDAGLAHRAVLAERMRVAEVLAANIAEVTAPLPIGGELVHSIGNWFMTVTPFVDGGHLDVANRNDARLMGRTLARLHLGLERLQPYSIPPVAALDLADADAHRSEWQLLHGDFSAQNTIRTPAGLRIFDFDDCGYGPVAYDLANSLYMVLFDSEVHDRPDRYRTFRPEFIDSYVDTIGSPVDDTLVDSMIDIRVSALDRWLDDLPNAPIGIRTSAPAWHRTLRAFVASYRSLGPSHLD